jgi:hypothetical protein
MVDYLTNEQHKAFRIVTVNPSCTTNNVLRKNLNNKIKPIKVLNEIVVILCWGHGLASMSQPSATKTMSKINK